MPHFLGATSEMVIGAIRAAEEQRSPLALGFAPEVFSMVPLTVAFPMMVSAAGYAAVPVATQLEHGHDLETIMKAIELGTLSIMFDGSYLPYEENVRRTREVVVAAHPRGVAVEAELGSVGGSAVDADQAVQSLFTDPEQVVDFVGRTGVDTLAVSFGNVHGRYHGVPDLDYDRIREISRRVATPLVMHGGSGLGAAEYRRSIQNGITNIHFYTGIAIGVWDRLLQGFRTRTDRPIYHEIAAASIDHFYCEAKRVIDMLGSAGRVGPA